MTILLLVLLAAEPPFGVEESRLAGQDRYRLHGQEVPRAAALQAIGDPPWPDVTRWRITVIGPGREAVLRDFAEHPALAPWRDRCAIRGYDAAHWHVAAGFVTTGQPTLYVQLPDGQVLHRQDDYADGAEGLAAALAQAGRLRKPAPDYKPEADRDLRRRLLPGFRVPASVYVLGAAVVVALVFRWRKT
jgi:hypothetical protein